MNRSTTSVVRSRAGSPSGQGWVSLLGGLVFQSHPRLLNGACLKREWGKERLLIPSQPYKQTNHCSQSLWAWFCLVLNGSSPLGSFSLVLRDCEQRRNQKEGPREVPSELREAEFLMSLHLLENELLLESFPTPGADPGCALDSSVISD